MNPSRSSSPAMIDHHLQIPLRPLATRLGHRSLSCSSSTFRTDSVLRSIPDDGSTVCRCRIPDWSLPSLSFRGQVYSPCINFGSATMPSITSVTVTVLWWMACFSFVRGEEALGASFIFGDSLVDAGNNNFLSTLSRANMHPNGIDFTANGGEPTGRFTNGRTIGDIVGELLGQPNYAQPFLSPNTTGSTILYGVNYASGGGGIMNQTGRIFVNRLGLEVQVDFFSETRQQLNQLLGKSKAREFLMEKAMFSVTIGSNDFLNNYLLPVLSMGERISETPDDFVESLISNLRAQLTRLYSLDARKFVVGNVGPIGCIPYQKTINGVGETECVTLPNRLAAKYNGRLRDLLTQLNEQLPEAKFVLANVYDLVMEVISNYKSHGFKTASAACCGNGGQFAGIIPCGPTSSMCEDRSKYVFWDPYHPSEAANLIIAKHLVDGETKFISPMNLRQLKNL